MANICAGEWVVVHGAGGVGQALIQYVRACGGRVIAIDLGAEKSALALRLGAEVALDALSDPNISAQVLAITGSGADVVFELIGTTETMRQSVTMLRRRGRIVLIGYTTDTLQIHPVELIIREATLLGSVGSTLQDLHEIVDLVARGVVTSVVDRTLPLDRFDEGLEALERRTTLGRIVLTM
nr:zinc-binding dehydrogenase [uncultured Lichenicoccus sp.]